MRVSGVVTQQAPDTPHLAAMTVLIVCFTFAACYFRFFVFGNVPILAGGDGPGFVSEGARIAAGQVPYRDFFEILPPGTLLTYALLIKIFGLFNAIPLLTLACLASATVLLMTLASARLMRGYVVLLPGLLLTGFVLLGSADATHHWFSTVFVLAGMLVLFGGMTGPRMAAAGALCGVAACFTQTKGITAILGFVAYMIWSSRHDNARGRELWRRSLILCAAAFAIFAAANSYFIATAGLRRWFYCMVTYPLRYYSAPSINNWRVILYDFEWHRSLAAWIVFPFVYCTVPAVYLVFLFVRRRWKGYDTGSRSLLMLVAFTGIAMFFAIASEPSVKRLSTVSPPAMILLAWLLDRPARGAIYFRTGLGAVAAAMAIAVCVRVQTRHPACLDLPGGRTAFVDSTLVEEYSWVLAHTHPGQFFWGMPPFYMPFRLQNPSTIQSFHTSEYTRPEDVAALVPALQRHDVPIIILASEEKYPLTVGGASNHLGPFVSYLRANYRETRTFANGDEVWEKDSPTSGDSTAESPR
ncbi:MAG TPA: hypothetical protein VFD98_13055 [Terracidiphilus sp.]|jgi:hypothetical protein|nr:hypothetical protein [Terracidiphilus sp.]